MRCASTPRSADQGFHGISHRRLVRTTWRSRTALALLCALTVNGACTHGRGAAGLGATPNGILTVAQRVDHLDVLSREPMVVQHPDGSLFVAGYGEPRPTLWKSHDSGATWT